MMDESELRKGITTYMAVLIKVLQKSEGDVIEFGAGPFSTPLLYWICKDMNRLLISYEDDPRFYNLARKYQSRLHRIRFVTNWNEIDTKTHRGVIFIDHGQETRRGTEAIRFEDTADYIVMHDTDAEVIYD